MFYIDEEQVRWYIKYAIGWGGIASLKQLDEQVSQRIWPNPDDDSDIERKTYSVGYPDWLIDCGIFECLDDGFVRVTMTGLDVLAFLENAKDKNYVDGSFTSLVAAAEKYVKESI